MVGFIERAPSVNGRIDPTNGWGELSSLKEGFRGTKVPSLVTYDLKLKKFQLCALFASAVNGDVPTAWVGLSTDLSSLVHLNIEDLAALVITIQEPDGLKDLPYRVSAAQISAKVFPEPYNEEGKFTEEDRWVQRMRDIYDKWGKSSLGGTGFEKFVNDFRTVVTKDSRERTLGSFYAVMRARTQSVDEIVAEYKNGNCDPRLVFVTNAVMLAFANQYPGQDIIPTKDGSLVRGRR
ncbi:hypothetical protein A2803_00675 [Candidatus Woesebacteria bacterium RIFCSPHIGHO2_01_FULL_44_21]|uniref:Uncharacterized protein n=1 Tax=Candidatus Woesebacteria bacterium RIFCSPHIGHO2_01_FULL_44_21 TaxID=1802503 RepID=A0A1F7YXJ2_9BACT|nr:MAG: hypothetical protein A2803_00675 [Candidatus Woesebacteria bacterium RIFCSPHIGHO2_01_FULL_44_21]OGM70376.1 MAG: hypothetical protein A2897_01105 [Candidatus Woesebacteria bacterium RIFCSPLOWO2_01_FULL_44_24b]